LIAPLVLWAQDEGHHVYHTPRDGYMLPSDAPLEYVLGNDVALRSGPATTAELVATLSAGTALTIEEASTEELELRGIRSAWYRVVAEERTGWLWGGDIAQHSFGSTADALVKFIGGVDHITPSDTGFTDFAYRIVALREGLQVQHIVLRSFANGFEGAMNHGDLGVPLVDDIITVHVPCVGGCGCTVGDVVVFWSGGRFHHVADLMGSPDGPYSTNEYFIYPSAMVGLPGTIIRETSNYLETRSPVEGETQEEEGLYIIRTVEREYLRWDGQSLVPSGRAAERTEHRMAVDQ
jgi:hypothetical protein